MHFSHFLRISLCASALPLAAAAQETRPDIVEEVREASRPRPSLENRINPPKPFQALTPTEDPQVARYLDPKWKLAQLYFDADNEWVQEFSLTGMLQARVVGSRRLAYSRGERSNDIYGGNRRSRLGARLKAFYNTTVEGNVEFRDDRYEGINDLKVRNHFNSETWISVGKMKAPFSAEWATHSSDLKVYDRSPLVAQLHPRRSIGALIEGQISDTWGYQVGLFSGDDHRELGAISDPFWFFGLNYDFSEQEIPNLKERLRDKKNPLPYQLTNRERWYLHYIYNQGAGGSSAIGASRVAQGAISRNSGNPLDPSAFRYRHMVATGLQFEQDQFSLNAEMLWAQAPAGSVWGLSIRPSYWVVPGRFEIVGRWAYAGADNNEGLLLNADPSRDFLYSNSAFFTGNSMHSFYLGGNYYPYADKFNLQGGVDFTQLQDTNDGDVNSWTYFLGSRVEF